jgi:hypothetical protein
MTQEEREDKTVTAQQVADYFAVAINTAKRYCKNARLYYEKRPKERVTLGQVKRSNKLEK